MSLFLRMLWFFYNNILLIVLQINNYVLVQFAFNNFFINIKWGWKNKKNVGKKKENKQKKDKTQKKKKKQKKITKQKKKNTWETIFFPTRFRVFVNTYYSDSVFLVIY